jgi:hypothetical protein
MSRVADLYETFHAFGRLEQRDLNWLRASGVKPRAMWHPVLILRGAVRLVGRALFDPAHPNDEEAKPAYLLLTRNSVGDPSDIVAWNPRIRFLRSLFGYAQMLGEEEIYAPRLECEGCLRVLCDPLDWLRLNRRGVVLLDGITSAPQLAAVGPLMVEDAAHRAHVLRLITTPSPKIYIARLSQAA